MHIILRVILPNFIPILFKTPKLPFIITRLYSTGTACRDDVKTSRAENGKGRSRAGVSRSPVDRVSTNKSRRAYHPCNDRDAPGNVIQHFLLVIFISL